VRVGFLCGGRALGDYRRVLRSLQETSADLSVHQDELRDAVSRLEAEVRQSRRDLKRALGELLAHEAEQLWRETREVDGLRLVSACWAERSFEEVRQLAMRLGERPRTVALLAAGDGQSLRLSCARSDDLGSRHAGDLLRAAAEVLGGRGGGTASVAQGGAPAQPCDRVLEVFRQVLR
jgi:alanyl-tRNA synthetase